MKNKRRARGEGQTQSERSRAFRERRRVETQNLTRIASLAHSLCWTLRTSAGDQAAELDSLICADDAETLQNLIAWFSDEFESSDAVRDMLRKKRFLSVEEIEAETLRILQNLATPGL